MVVRRVTKARKAGATRTANPAKRRRKTSAKRKTATRTKTKRRRRVSNPSAKRVANPRKRRANPSHIRRKRRNPSTMLAKGKAIFSLAGVDMGAVAIGTGLAVLIKNGVNSLGFVQDLLKKLPESLQPFASPALVVGAGWAIHKYAKNPMLKKIGAYAAVAAVVLAVDDFASQQMDGMFGGTYLNIGGRRPKLAGAFVQLPKRLSGMSGSSNLSGAYVGQSSMFGGINNLG